ncbi:hypothetical protein BDN72DRAFT_859533 [Pluteus cervinus]|uniref:Uncharacterized protein n=1 Tax=Pluteus cervinus TaxID=181527 RepID=A0ACD3AN48_9AGAR|nr:hypothetical protein BDN72DRAFT_859533 [Pluteus cervinus]
MSVVVEGYNGHVEETGRDDEVVLAIVKRRQRRALSRLFVEVQVVRRVPAAVAALDASAGLPGMPRRRAADLHHMAVDRRRLGGAGAEFEAPIRDGVDRVAGLSDYKGGCGKLESKLKSKKNEIKRNGTRGEKEKKKSSRERKKKTASWWVGAGERERQGETQRKRTGNVSGLCMQGGTRVEL